MVLNNSQVSVDIKVSDRMRRWLSNMLTTGTIELKCVMLGDSDIDYELTPNMNNARILNAPFNPEAIKFPLIYNGLGNGVKGVITSFIRFVDENGEVSSYYDYPLNLNLSFGRVPPTLENGIDIETLDFDSTRSGRIIFLQTLLDYYVDENGVQQRLKESYDLKVFFDGTETVPSGWQVIRDDLNGSLLLAKNNISLTDPSGTYSGLIEIKGSISKIEKTIKFNI